MGILRGSFTFDWVDSKNYGCYISGDAVYDAPARKGQKIQIPGRNGELIMDENAFENIAVTYPAFIHPRTYDGFDTNIQALRDALTHFKSYRRLTDSYHPEEFRLAAYREGLEVEPVLHNSAGKFNLVFDCKPQRFLVSGEDPIIYTSGGTIQNPTWFASSPLLEVTGNGYFEISGYRITVENNPGKIYIDTDIVEAWSESGGVKTSQNGNVTYRNHAIMKIASGTTNVVLSGITKLVVTPRWWRL